jgi:hypothetical protein
MCIKFGQNLKLLIPQELRTKSKLIEIPVAVELVCSTSQCGQTFRKGASIVP